METNILNVLLYYINFGRGEVFILFLVLALSYILWNTAVLSMSVLSDKNQEALSTIKLMLPAVLRGIVIFTILLTAAGMWIEIVDTYPQTRADIANHNNILMAADRLLFGTYAPLWFQMRNNQLKPVFDASTRALISAYESLGVVLSLTLIGTLAVSARLFQQFFAACFICLFLAIPIWYLFPASSPITAYLYPIIQSTPPDSVQDTIALYEPNEILSHKLKERAMMDRHVAGRFINVTAMPSMHIAWVVLILLFGAAVSVKTLYISIPYFLLVSISSLFMLQHYAFDIISGTLVAIAAAVIAHHIHTKESTGLQLFRKLLQRDFRILLHFTRNLLSAWKRYGITDR